MDEAVDNELIFGENGHEKTNPGDELNQPEELHSVTHLGGMYRDWFLDYASYVILERAVPHLDDGLKPVQRRILHAMKRLDDGRFNKVANIIGYTMQYHPHGDASIGDALVQIGQKDILVETQGNWGNILTGDSSAAPRYIEARLSKFALEVVFNPKTTQWKLSYDGRNKEPLTLPVKFPLLLAQGVEGIAVGLASKILPHNFNELIDASVAYLQGKDFVLYPDFPTGGLGDFSKYNDGIRGGVIKVRAKIVKIDKKTLCITEVPFGKTTSTLIESIIKANEKGKIKIRKIDDNTAEHVEILIHLAPGISPDKTIDALFAFTDCEVPISPNSCVISEDKPCFLPVSRMLRLSADRTVHLLKMELEIRLNELNEEWHLSSLEKIFIENRIYLSIEKCETWESVIETIDKELESFKKLFFREITREDIIALTEIKIKRISKYDANKSEEHIKQIETDIEEVKNHLQNLVPYAINYFKQIKKKYGAGRERKTEIRFFDSIEATKVVVANEKLYVNREEGFVGTGLRKDEYVGECSDLDDVIAIRRDGTYKITKVDEKSFVGKDIIHVAVFRKNDERTIYNVIYRDGLNGAIMMKRCAIAGLTRDKEYNLTKGSKDSKILYLSVNPNGEAEVVKVFLKPRPRLKSLTFDLDFSELAIKGRGSIGNILTRYGVHKIVLSEKGESTLGGKPVWFDKDVNRLNEDRRGEFLGEFTGSDKILVVTKKGFYRLTNTDVSNHFEDDVLFVEKFREKKVFSAVYYDPESKFHYLKRFNMEPTEKLTSFIGEHPESALICLMDDELPRLQIEFGGKHAKREAETVLVADFIAVKGTKAKGKRLSNYEIKKVEPLEPIQPAEKPAEIEEIAEPENSQTETLLDLDEPGVSQMKLDI
jgi:topoisomerase IV subunit A